MSFTIAVAGKGGVGKTTLCGLMIDYLSRKGKTPILAVDADANANLNEVLGVDVEMTLGEIREEVTRAEMSKENPIPKGMTKSKKRLNKRLSEFVSGNSFIEVGDIDHSIDYLHNAAMLVIFYGKNNQIFDFNNINYFLACYKSAPSPSPFARLMYNSAIYFPPILRGQKKLIFHYPELVVVR